MSNHGVLPKLRFKSSLHTSNDILPEHWIDLLTRKKTMARRLTSSCCLGSNVLWQKVGQCTLVKCNALRVKNEEFENSYTLIYNIFFLTPNYVAILARSAAINHLLPKIILERKLKLTILQNPRMIEGITILCNTKNSLPEMKTIKCDVDGSFNRMFSITRTQFRHTNK